ncbi:Uncharacterized protein BP5553_01498 [Venustampulla echinocandica]|uniref:Xylanolytic transcriptional activator regulatory domain-containing protein n=1 Tax=Venustampulla echinocandica TaxID=2656787 RepID=A0A370U162_9HELO|nr:Uncharacterized protein BP5553_01498 [Venustampulla echinocandica]RDL41519.1 Uncharacterized protein BP5553_01498 [Venustampulla echinocandica]
MNNQTPSPQPGTTLAASNAPSDAASDTDGPIAEEALPHQREAADCNVEHRPQNYQPPRRGLQPTTSPKSRGDLPGHSSRHSEGPTIQNVFTGDSSTIGLTREVFGFNDSQHDSITSAMPGGASQPSSDNVGFQKSITETAQLPPAAVVEALIDSYFDTVHWFMFILHENSFREQARRIIAKASSDLTAEDAEFITLLMMVLAFGAQYAAKNPRWKFRAVIEKHSIDLHALTENLIQHVRSRLLDSLERCQVEVVQICVLLGTFYIYHGKPNLSWSILGLAVKCAYALTMHREVDWRGSNVVLQTRKRAWAHTFISDTFAAVIYGRPPTVNRAFCDISFPDEFDDTQIPMPLRALAERLNSGKSISKLTFHTHKYRLYDLKAQIVNKIYTLSGRAGFSAAKGIVKLVNTIHGLDKRLRDWYDGLPPFFKYAEWKDMQRDPFDELEKSEAAIPASQERSKRHLILQAISLQVSYDNILILLHRPLLEYKMSSHREGSSPEVATNDPFAYSFNTCMSAAMRISRTPAHKFENDMPLALMSTHMFTAGVILCIPATMSPFSSLAHNAKAGVVRIIQMHKRLSKHTQIALQSHTILEELMKVAIKRELDMMLQPTEHQQLRNNYEERMGSGLTYVSTAGESTPVLLPSGGMVSGTVASRNGQLYANQTLPDGQRPSGESQLALGAMAEHNSSLEFDAHSSGMASYSVPVLTNTNNVPLSHPIYEGSTSAISPDGVDYGQNYNDLGAEPDNGFNSAFGALEKVMYDLAPSEWLDPAWMHPLAISDLQSPTEHRPQDGLSGSAGTSQAGLPAAVEPREISEESRASLPAIHGGAAAERHIGATSLHNFAEAGPSWLWGLNRIT